MSQAPKPSRLARFGPVALLAAYAAGLLALARGLTVDYWDGLILIDNALVAAGRASPTVSLSYARPPVGWLLLTPAIGLAHRFGGPRAALVACHCLMPLFLVALVAAGHLLFRRLFSPLAAWTATLALALNPLLLQYAPFALLDIFAALAALPFLWAAFRFCARPSPRAWALALAAYALAFLSKYHLGVLVLAPLAFTALEPSSRPAARRLKDLAASPLWLLPPLGWALGVLAWALIARLVAGDREPLSQLLASGHRALWSNLVTNVASHTSPEGRALYARSLWRQLGPALSVLAGAGAWLQLRDERSPEQRYLALCLLVPLAALSAFSYQEQRYAIPLLLFVYAAAGRGLEAARSRLRGAGAAAAAVALAAAPWPSISAALRYPLEDSSVRTEAPWRLAALAESEAAAGRCLGWRPGSMAWTPQTVFPLGYDLQPELGAPTLQALARGPVKDLGRPASLDCAVSVEVEPNRGPDGRPRWEGPELARLYRDGKPAGSVFLGPDPRP